MGSDMRPMLNNDWAYGHYIPDYCHGGTTIPKGLVMSVT